MRNGAEAVQLVPGQGFRAFCGGHWSWGAIMHTSPPSAELPAKLPYSTVRIPLLLIAPPHCANSNRKIRKEKKSCEIPARDIASPARHFSPELTACHGVRSLFGHPRSISSPIVQVHVVVWKGEGAELWVKRCTVKSLLCPGPPT